MLNSSSNSNAEIALNSQPKGMFQKMLIATFLAVILGATLVALLPGPQGPEISAFIFGALFGGWVGLVSSFSFYYIRRVRRFAMRSRLWTVLAFMGLSGVSGALAMFWFGDGFRMAFGLALEGLVFGAAIGTLVGVFVLLIEKWKPTSRG
jgi:hypothetical protein